MLLSPVISLLGGCKWWWWLAGLGEDLWLRIWRHIGLWS